MIEVLQPGLLTTLQDLGRTGYQRYGVIVSGAMDPFAHRVANLLVGNPENTPTLELTLLGPTLRFTQTTLIAVTGGGMWPMMEGDVVPLWRPLLVAAGTVLQFQPNVNGCRAYLAVAGGFSVPEVMDSASTYLRAGIGGFQGRALQKGDELPTCEPSAVSRRRIEALRTPAMSAQSDTSWKSTTWFADFSMMPYHRRSVLHTLPGPQFDHFTEEAKSVFFHQWFTVSAQSDRMGYRLSGPTLPLKEPAELLSEAVTNGTVQVPADGNPVVLLADHPTTGGYPKIAQVATVDLPLLAQVRPGERIRFEPIFLQEAQALLYQQEQNLQQLRLALELK